MLARMGKLWPYGPSKSSHPPRTMIERENGMITRSVLTTPDASNDPTCDRDTSYCVSHQCRLSERELRSRRPSCRLLCCSTPLGAFAMVQRVFRLESHGLK
ncbi:hypothetical protein NPIL_146101 [Nephila pilipes]|uniref:Uncharacterized protein n=1 Tax=Nephila pilipes TaxID=299642 RepID=A0A8X6NAZ4_NEPPI|nr:hypothetical protein NPIL_146101 [Nephila pilipes]